MAAPDIEQLLAVRLGLDATTIGPAAVRSAIRLAMAEAGSADATAYAQRLAVDPAAWERLIDRVVVPETWFFRDGAPFDLAADLAWSFRLRAPGRALRLLSCPCSTGEEPYSLAMALVDRGLPTDSFAVHATDVSRRAVEAARAGVFRANSFRGPDLSYQERHFDRVEASGWRLHDATRGLVSVYQGNILSPDFLRDQLPFDIVFCRNLLIYLHADAKAVVMGAVRRLLAPDGVLVVGHAEAAIAREHGFAPAGPPAAFGFALSTRRLARKAETLATSSRPPDPARRRFVEAPASTANRVVPAAATSAAAVAEEPTLARAKQLADAGHVQEAMRSCAEYLARVPDSAEAHFLMGVLHDAEGRWQLASPSFRRALYLDPTHVGALRHLALKREASGDRAGAALLRARARRAGDGSNSE